ncbi:terminase [Candidatus Poribacteria bacterium]|nr:terminase [Candidatus Poribacteria bacterium]
MNQVAIYKNPSGFNVYGAAKVLFACKDPEVIISGPYETGKTRAALTKIHLLLSKYPQARGLMLRKTYKSLHQSALITFEKRVLPCPSDSPQSPLRRFGGEKPEWYDYPNGSRLVIGGLDNPDKILSSEYDFIYVNQVEELTLDEWEKLTARCTGRAGNAPYTQIIGDCQPASQLHWILKRDRVTLLHSRHQDNPMLFDPQTHELTIQGRKTMDTLDALTGIRKKRGRDGLWVSVEGQVYEFEMAIHLIDRFEIPKEWIRFRAIDFGYTNPFVCQWWAVDSDGRLYLYREIYMTQRTVRIHAKQILKLSLNESISYTVADHDAEDRATLEENGIRTRLADKRISVGIEAVAERLKLAGDGKPRIFFLRDSLVETDQDLETSYQPTHTIQEFSDYIYPTVREGKSADEKPIDKDNHGMDAKRYAVMSRAQKRSLLGIVAQGKVKGW